MQIQYINKKQILKVFNVSKNTYALNYLNGCNHACSYPCYYFINSIAQKQHHNFDDFKIVKYDPNTLQKIKNELTLSGINVDYVFLLKQSDFFQYDNEKKELNTEIKTLSLSILKLFIQQKINYFILTKAYYPSEILNIDNAENKNIYGISLISLDEKIREKYETNTAPYTKRIEALKILSQHKLKTYIFIAPLLIFNLIETKKEIYEILEKIKFVNKIIFIYPHPRITQNPCKATPKMWLQNTAHYKIIDKIILEYCKNNNIQYLATNRNQQKNDAIFLFLRDKLTHPLQKNSFWYNIVNLNI